MVQMWKSAMTEPQGSKQTCHSKHTLSGHSDCVEPTHGAALVVACCFRYRREIRYNPGSPVWVNSLENLKTSQMAKPCTMVYNSTQRPDFTTLESNQCGNYIMFCCDNRELNSRSALFVLETNPPGMCACTYFIGQRGALWDDFELFCSKCWAWFNFLANERKSAAALLSVQRPCDGQQMTPTQCQHGKCFSHIL